MAQEALTQPGQREPQGQFHLPETQGLRKTGTRQCYHRPRFLVSSLFQPQHKVFPLLPEHSVRGMGMGGTGWGGAVVGHSTQVQTIRRSQLLSRISNFQREGPRKSHKETLQLK